MEFSKCKKQMSWLVAAVTSILFALFLSLPLTVSAAEAGPESVHVIIENTTYAQTDGAAWDGTLLEKDVALTDGMTALDAVQAAAESEACPIALNETGSYITEIKGLKEFAGSEQAGWMGTVNDCFGNVALSETPVKAGDEIRIMYTMAWGSDLRINVLIENTTYTEESAAWSGEKLNLGVRAVEGLTALDAVKQAAAAAGIELEIENDSYITGIDGLEQLAGSAQAGWMGSVNDCFGNVALADTPVKAGDEIRMMYTMSWGSDLRINVIVENNTFSQDAGAVWDGERFNIGVRAVDELTALDAVKIAAAATGTELEIENDSYITGIQGLNQQAGGEQSGWMGKVNGTFGEVGLNETAVKAGDEIRIQYTIAWGNDLGSTEQNISNQYTGSKAMVVGQKLTQTVTGAMTDVTFTSSDPKVATVNETTGAVTCKGVGKAVITSTAAGSREYKAASASVTLTVKPQAVGVKSVTSKKAKQVTVQSNGVAKSYCDGYKIQYRQARTGKGKTIDVKNTNKKALTKVISNLKSGKLCQVRICAYQKVNGKTYTGKYGAWKTLKKVK